MVNDGSRIEDVALLLILSVKAPVDRITKYSYIFSFS